ncbi:MAG: ketopantoate reductase family protein [Candidatus Gastranaerophilales bacterium]|nr:ketopantoate reductase family protein [Candidatus Gastranaerophilales bacterium]
MKKIEKVLLCGLGGIGSVYAKKILDNSSVELRVLVDKKRYEKYSNTPRCINGKNCNFSYVLPDNCGFKTDLIIIAVKSSGLDDIIPALKNFISEDTIILSFVNGVTSEEQISSVYGKNKLLYSYVICHTVFRNGSNISHDGITKVVFGSRYPSDEKVNIVKNFFDETGLDYEIPDDIYKSLWLKFSLNCCANQISAITGMTFGQMLTNSKCIELMQNICSEVAGIAKAAGVEDTSHFWAKTLENLNTMLPDGKTSMLQDIEAGRITENDLFGKTVVKFAKIHNIPVFYNKILSQLIECITK